MSNSADERADREACELLELLPCAVAVELLTQLRGVAAGVAPAGGGGGGTALEARVRSGLRWLRCTPAAGRSADERAAGGPVSAGDDCGRPSDGARGVRRGQLMRFWVSHLQGSKAQCIRLPC